MTALILVAGAAGLWLAGYGLAVLLCDRPASDAVPFERIGLALPLGIAANSCAMFAWSWAGGSLSSTLSWSLTGIGSVVGLAVLIGQRRRVPGVRVPDSLTSPNSPLDQTVRDTSGNKLAPAGNTLARCCQSIIAIVLVGAFVLALVTPQRFWDERAIFGIKSKVLFTDGTIYSPSLADPDFVQGHPRYPLLIPLAETHVYALLGRIDDRWAKGIFPLLFAGLVLAYGGRLSGRFGPGAGWLFTLLLATLPLLAPYELGFITAQGDAPVACYHGLAVLYAWDWLRSRELAQVESGRLSSVRRALLVGVLSAAAAFTKDEGVAHLLVGIIALTMAWCWGWLRSRRVSESRPFRISALVQFLAVAGVTIAVLLTPWFAHRRTLPTTNEMQYFARLSTDRLSDQFDALSWLVPHILTRMFREWSTWGLQWWLLLVAAVTAPRRILRPAQLFILLEILGGIAALMVAGMVAPAELHEHIAGSSHRYLLQLAPLAVLFAAGQWGEEAG